jgi:hypothetical protein
LKKNIFPEDITLESYDDTRGRKFYKLWGKYYLGGGND